MSKPKNRWQEVFEIGSECNERFVDYNKVPEMAQFHIPISGVSNLAGKYCVGRVNPDYHTVLYCVDGSIRLHNETGIQDVGKCNLMTLPAHKPFLMELVQPSWTMVWFALEDIEKWRTLIADRPAVTCCDSAKQLFHALSIIYYERDPQLRKPIINQLSHYLNDTLCAPTSETIESQRLTQLIRDIEKRLHCNWTVEEMSKLVNYSAPHLHRLFQKYFSRSPIQHLIFLRMERAKYLLINTAWTIEHIAEQVGYTDVFNFSKRFKKSVGIPPGKFRKGGADKVQHAK
ncbi:helix-turn-helix transcriptional regulator [Catenovulum sediminis]|uniref:helix-turn-helix transcriptional regulator n=1 Tax=Catenovulum sediminis TaxID=1740262 RepID=UPI00117EA19E|nr:AraC family transcriptional regulator [Catenovulum sediminis]